jgi:hypothetical protein
MISFQTKIRKIGINPYVLLPDTALYEIFSQANKNKGSIAVKGSVDGQAFTQTLVKYSGKWRLYLNGIIRKTAGKDVGDIVEIALAFDPQERKTEMHPKLNEALISNNEAFLIFSRLSPSRQREIMRYINNLKSEDSVTRNITRAIQFLLRKDRFVGRDKP